MKSKPSKSKSEKKRDNTDNTYTVTEVGTLLEALDKKIDTIAEGHSGLDSRMERLEVEVHGNSRRLEMLELGSSVIKGKATRLEDAASKLSKDLRETREELKEEMSNVKAELKTDIADVKTELKAEIAGVKTEFKEEIRSLGDRLTSAESRL